MTAIPHNTAQADPNTASPKVSPTQEEVMALMQKPLLELVFEAAQVHRAHHDPADLQCAQLLSIKTGACPEDCSYCPQSAHHNTDLEPERLLDTDEVIANAKAAAANGADRFCMGAAWRHVKDGPDFDRVVDMVTEVKRLGLETCVTLGMLKEHQAQRLKDAGLDYYNHNLDTGRSHYGEIISTRDYDERLETLRNVRDAGMSVCCGGIVGMGEPVMARAELLAELAGMDPQPESVPVNALVRVKGTPLEDQKAVPWDEVVRVVAAARILMPKAAVRLSAGRTEMAESTQAMCFLAGANSVFVGDELLTTPNPGPSTDAALFAKLGLQPKATQRHA